MKYKSDKVRMIIAKFIGELTKEYLEGSVLPKGYIAHQATENTQEFFVTLDGFENEEHGAGWVSIENGELVVTVFVNAPAADQFSVDLKFLYPEKEFEVITMG